MLAMRCKLDGYLTVAFSMLLELLQPLVVVGSVVRLMTSFASGTGLRLVA